MKIECKTCKGTGTVADYVGDDMRCIETACPDCKGTGGVREEIGMVHTTHPDQTSPMTVGPEEFLRPPSTSEIVLAALREADEYMSNFLESDDPRWVKVRVAIERLAAE